MGSHQVLLLPPDSRRRPPAHTAGRFLGLWAPPHKALLWTRGGSLALSRVLLGALPALSTRSLGQADPCAAGRFLRTEGWEDSFRSHLSVHCGGRVGGWGEGAGGGIWEGKCRRRKLGRKASGPWLGRGWGEGRGVRRGTGPLADLLCDMGEAAYVTSLGLSFPLKVRPLVPPSQGCCEDNTR